MLHDLDWENLISSAASPFAIYQTGSASDARFEELIWIDRIIGIPFHADDSYLLAAQPDRVPVIAVSKGNVHVRSELLTGTLVHGQLIFLPPDSGTCRLAAHDAGECMIALLCGQLANAVLKNHFDENRLFCPSGLSDVLETVNTLKRAGCGQEEISLAAYTLLMRLHGAAQPYVQTSGYPLLVDAAMGIMREEFAKLYGVEEVAERLGISPAYLSRSFSKAVGMPPGRFLRLQKIACAKKLLIQPDMTVSLTAQLVGFADVHYFSRVFRRETGMLPSAYRQSHTAAPSEDADIKRMLDELYL